MTQDDQQYPNPRVDQINNVFVEAWAEGKLRLQVCGACGEVTFYPRPLCPHCWSSDLGWVDHDGKATLVSYSLVMRPNHPAFFEETPIILAEIALQDGPTMLARVISDDPAQIRSGLSLELLPVEEGKNYPLPTFRPVL